MTKEFTRQQIVTVPTPTRDGYVPGRVIGAGAAGRIRVRYVFDGREREHDFEPTEIQERK